MVDSDLENIKRIEHLILSLEEVLFSLTKRYADKISLQATGESS
jgi:hypothetical protein